jgi:tetratricopeptide (TPR) repeat protein
MELWARADERAADRYLKQAMPLADELGAREDMRWLTHQRALILWERGDLDAAMNLLTRNLAEYRELGDRFGEAMVLSDLGQVHRDAGDYHRAAQLLEGSVALLREFDERPHLAATLHGLGDLALDQDDLAAAASRYSEGLGLATQEPLVAGCCLAGIAAVLARRGHSGQAATLWGAVTGAEDRLGFRMNPVEQRRYENYLDMLRDMPEWSAGRELTLDEAVSRALASLD